MAPSGRAKYNAVEIDFDDCLIKGVSAKSKRMANRAVRRVSDITGAPKKEPVNPLLGLPGFGDDTKKVNEEKEENDE